jgi:hypothetical protein
MALREFIYDPKRKSSFNRFNPIPTSNGKPVFVIKTEEQLEKELANLIKTPTFEEKIEESASIGKQNKPKGYKK